MPWSGIDRSSIFDRIDKCPGDRGEPGCALRALAMFSVARRVACKLNPKCTEEVVGRDLEWRAERGSTTRIGTVVHGARCFSEQTSCHPRRTSQRSMLSSAHPGVGYESSLVRVLPFGVDKELSKLRRIDADTPYIGALDLRMDEFGHSLFTAGGIGPQVEIGGRRMTAKKVKDADSGRDFPVEHESFDLVIMKPSLHASDGTRGGKDRRSSAFVRWIRYVQGRTTSHVQKA